MTDCWLDRNGRVYNVEPFQHDAFAQEYLATEYPIDDIQNWEANGFSLSFENTLSVRGWVRYTTASNSWVYNPERTLSNAQLNRIYELGGRISRYTGYPFRYEEYERL